MSVVSLKSPYVNNDGLPVYFPGDAGTVTKGGERDYDGRHETFVVIDLLALSTAAPAAGGNECIVAENVTIPAGAFIEDVQVFVLKETTGTNANLDLGLVKHSDRSTEIDFNGLLTAADGWNGGTDLGAVYTYSIDGGSLTTDGGALIGTKLASTGLITASPDTADFTAGVIEVRIHWFVPLSGDV